MLAESLEGKGYWDSVVFLLGSHAIRNSRSLEEAEAFLRRGASHLERDEFFHYFMACYACLRGDMPGATACLRKAFCLDPGLRILALEDSDLAPLHAA